MAKTIVASVIGPETMFVADASLDGDEGIYVGQRKLPVMLEDGYILLVHVTAHLDGRWYLRCDECGTGF